MTALIDLYDARHATEPNKGRRQGHQVAREAGRVASAIEPIPRACKARVTSVQTAYVTATSASSRTAVLAAGLRGGFDPVPPTVGSEICFRIFRGSQCFAISVSPMCPCTMNSKRSQNKEDAVIRSALRSWSSRAAPGRAIECAWPWMMSASTRSLRMRPPDGPDRPEPFRRGEAATWRDLDLHHDCDRTMTAAASDRVRADLRDRALTPGSATRRD